LRNSRVDGCFWHEKSSPFQTELIFSFAETFAFVFKEGVI
jgi:hypothetical protein